MRWVVVALLLSCGRIAFDPRGDAMVIAEPSCSDVMQNGDELGIDCGGSCAIACPGATCGDDADCITGNCTGTCELAPLSWRPGPPLARGRYDLACATAGGAVYATGGSIQGGPLVGDVEVLDPTASAFTLGPPLTIPRTLHAIAPTADDRIVVIGGSDGFTAIASVEIFDGSWSPGAPLPAGRQSMSATLASNGWIYVPDLAATEVYDPDNNTWDVVAAVGRDQYGIASDGDFVYVIGGSNAGSALNRVDALSVSSGNWVPRASLPGARDDLAAVRAPDGRLYAIAGDPTGTPLDSVDAYTPAHDTWTTTPPLLTARTNHCATLARDGRIFAIGGSSGGANALASTELYGPVLTLDRRQAPVGDTVVVSGEGFAPNAVLAVLLDGAPVAAAMTNATGDVVTSFVMPARPPGAHVVTAIDQRAQYPVTQPLQVP